MTEGVTTVTVRSRVVSVTQEEEGFLLLRGTISEGPPSSDPWDQEPETVTPFSVRSPKDIANRPFLTNKRTSKTELPDGTRKSTSLVRKQVPK